LSVDYTPTGTTAQAPAPAPSLDTPVIVRLPESTDAFSASAHWQALKALAESVELHRQILRNARKLLVRDHFVGSAIDTGRWTGGGSPTAVDDSASGGSGAALLDGSSGGGAGQYIQTLPLALSTSNFRLYVRMRNLSIAGTSNIQVGVTNSGTGKNLLFYIDGSTSTTNFRVAIDNASTPPNGTAAAISSSYKDFIITRVSNAVTFSVDGVALHTIGSYTSNLDGALFYHFTATSGIARIDFAEIELL
jgi:hypothetical protein